MSAFELEEEAIILERIEGVKEIADEKKIRERASSPTWDWLVIFTGEVIQVDEFTTIPFEDYSGWLDLARIPREFAKDPEVQNMHHHLRLPPSWAHHEFFFRLHRLALVK